MAITTEQAALFYVEVEYRLKEKQARIGQLQREIQQLEDATESNIAILHKCVDDHTGIRVMDLGNTKLHVYTGLIITRSETKGEPPTLRRVSIEHHRK